MLEDWRDALENLSTNARHEIISLTSIARDYTSYAYGISESLEEHIKKVGVSAHRLLRLHCAVQLNFSYCVPAYPCIIETIIAKIQVGSSAAEAAAHLSFGLDREEYRYSLYALLRQESLPDVYGRLCLRQ